MNERAGSRGQMPEWVPEAACRYLAHTEAGQSIRDLAREGGVHASTVLRQVRRMETRRDDPLVDCALNALASRHYTSVSNGRVGDKMKDPDIMTSPNEHPGDQPDRLPENQIENQPENLPDKAILTREACRVLPRLCETGAVLAVADQMEKAVVVRDAGAGGAGARTAVVDRAIARAMALQDWISCSAPGRISRYRITAAGRAALGQMLAEGENRARHDQDTGFAESQAGFLGPSGENPGTNAASSRPRVTQNWDNFLTSGTGGGHGSGGIDSCSLARDRMKHALGDLGQGLGDVALRCCCYLEGLEVAEKRLGWSARSGKIVLRIALQRLRQHYDGLSGPDRMIG